MKLRHYVSLFLIVFLYFVFRLGWANTIEFGYDQPMLAARVIDFIKSPTFINSYSYVIPTPWGYPSWGPMQIFSYAPFLLIAKNPIIISFLVAAFNVLSILTIFYIGKRFFSVKVGLIAALFLALHPWWIVFSRMIYEPSLLPTFISISMLLSYYFFEKPSGKKVIPLVLSWAIMFQIYFHSTSFIAASFLGSASKIKEISKKYLVVGIFVASILYIPYVVHFQSRPDDIIGFLKVSQKFDSLRAEVPYSIKNITYEFLGTVSGGRFKWQLGYGYDDFIKSLPRTDSIGKIGVLLAVFFICYNLVRRRFLLLSWLIGPVLFLSLIKTPAAPPRYFLISLPPAALLFAITIEELSVKLKSFKLFVYFVLVIIFGWWIVFMINYYNFVGNYSYPRGYLSSYSDVPYNYLDKSFRWILTDAAQKGYREITISDSFDKAKIFSLNQAQRYYWEYYLGRKQKVSTKSAGHYFMYYGPPKPNAPKNLARFGPYVVYEIKN